jgi:hypothetical protein
MVLTNANVLCEGFDEPSVDCVIIGRPTKSRPFYQQMIGRGTRLFPNKSDCLIIDIVGVTNRLDLVTASNLEGLELKPGESAREGAIRRRIEQEKIQLAKEEREQLIAKEIQLFHERRIHWVHDQKYNTYILPLGPQGGSLVIRPAEDEWTLIRRHPAKNNFRMEILGTMGFDAAIVEAERIAHQGEFKHIFDADAPWRQQDNPSTPSQNLTVQQLKPYGIELPFGHTKSRSEVSDLIAIGCERRSRRFENNQYIKRGWGRR